MGSVIHCPGKINLWLEVLRKRSDGYHDLSSLMLPIAVYDRLEVELCAGGGVSVCCDHPRVPSDERNLAWKAADLYLKAIESKDGVRIHLRKHIPVAGGLGGGSSNAAGVLLTLNRLHESGLDAGKLHALALSLGADVPFFLRGRPALATGIGEHLEEVMGVPDYPLVVVNPPLEVSTAWVYGSLQLTRGVSHIKLRSFQLQPWRLEQVLQNDLERVTLAEHPRLCAIKEWLLSQGALGALMSGSGPTLFGVFSDAAAAVQAGGRARDAWNDCWVGVTRVMGSSSPANSELEPQAG